MLRTPGAFPLFLYCLRAGDPDAWDELVRTYGPRLLRFLRRALRPYEKRLRRLYDPADLFQDVLVEFFQSCLPNRDIRDAQHLTRSLTQVARCAVIDLVRHGRRTKRDWRRDVSLDGPVGAAAAATWVARAPGPYQVAAWHDEWQQFLLRLPPKYRPALWLIAHGHPLAEVARELELCETTVRRLHDHVLACGALVSFDD